MRTAFLGFRWQFLFISSCLALGTPLLSVGQDQDHLISRVTRIRDTQLANLQKFDSLLISAKIRLRSDQVQQELFDIIDHSITSETLVLYSSKTREQRLNDDEDLIAPPVLFGGTDGLTCPWSLLEKYEVDSISSKSKDGTFVVTLVLPFLESDRIFIACHMKEQNAYYPHFTQIKLGERKEDAKTVREICCTYQILNDVVLPKVAIRRDFNLRQTGKFKEKTIVVTDIVLNDNPAASIPD